MNNVYYFKQGVVLDSTFFYTLKYKQEFKLLKELDASSENKDEPP